MITPLDVSFAFVVGMRAKRLAPFARLQAVQSNTPVGGPEQSIDMFRCSLRSRVGSLHIPTSGKHLNLTIRWDSL
jgi:hypothetical protein